MGKRSFSYTNWTPTATADTTAMANDTYMALKGASATARNEVLEIYMAGMVASTSSPTFTVFALSSTVATTPTTLAAPSHDGPLDPSSVTAATVSFRASAAGPQRSVLTTLPRLNLGINAWGGIVRWVAAHREEYILYGASASSGEATLSAFTGGTPGAMNAHIIYEVV